MPLAAESAALDPACEGITRHHADGNARTRIHARACRRATVARGSRILKHDASPLRRDVGSAMAKIHALTGFQESSCPACGATIHAEPKSRKRKVQCPKCREI